VNTIAGVQQDLYNNQQTKITNQTMAGDHEKTENITLIFLTDRIGRWQFFKQRNYQIMFIN
jgi:hypothetical protein